MMSLTPYVLHEHSHNEYCPSVQELILDVHKCSLACFYTHDNSNDPRSCQISQFKVGSCSFLGKYWFYILSMEWRDIRKKKT